MLVSLGPVYNFSCNIDVFRSYVEQENEKRKGLQTEDDDEEVLTLDMVDNEQLCMQGTL